MLGSFSAFLWVQNTLWIYFPLEPRQEAPTGWCGMGSGISHPGVQRVGCHPCLQDSLGSVRRRIVHHGLRYPEQSDLDCLAAFGCCSS